MPSQIQLFKTKRFLPLFVTQFFGAFNDNAFKNALLIWFTYEVAQDFPIGAPMMVTIAAGLFILPFFLFSATAGQVADKFEKSGLTRIIKLVEIVLMIACGVCFYMGSLYGLLGVLFLMGVQSTFFGPIKYSLLPEHLEDSELIGGNGLIEGGTFLAILLGTLFGGLIITGEHGVAVLSGCVVFFSIVGWVSSRSIPKTRVHDPELVVSHNFLRETLRIIKFAKEEYTVWLAIIGISWFWLIGATILTQLPTYTVEVIGGSEEVVTFFLTLFSVGIGVGSVMCNRLLRGEINGRLVPYGCFGISASLLAWVWASGHFPKEEALVGLGGFLGVGGPAWGIVVSLLMIAVFSGIYIVPLYAIMQHRSDEQRLSRIIAANNVMNSLFMVISSVLALGLLAVGVSVLGIFVTIGVLNIGVYFIIKNIVRDRIKKG